MSIQAEQDREANYFAMCLLMPEAFVKKEVKAMGGTIDLTNDRTMKMLAKKFGVSETVMTLRLVQIYDGAKVI